VSALVQFEELDEEENAETVGNGGISLALTVWSPLLQELPKVLSNTEIKLCLTMDN